MADRRKGGGSRGPAKPVADEKAKSDARAHGLVTDEGVDEDRTGESGPTLEEGAPKPGEPVGKRHRPGGS
jgi:hypothetical protein